MAALTTSLVRASRIPVTPALSVIATSRRHESNVFRDQTSNLAAYRRGRGGRSSFNGQVATVFGATGFIGRYIINQLGKAGSQVVVPYRGDPYDVKDLKLAGDLGQVLFMPYNLRDEDAIAKAVRHSNIVVNLVGREWETRNFSFRDVHVDGAGRLARISREAGVETFIHFGHLNAQPNPPSILKKGGSQFLIAKYEGEQIVRQEFPDSVIFKPSAIYGHEDRFLRYYASIARRSRGNVPLWKKGEETIKIPIAVSDIAQAVIQAIQHPEYMGQSIMAIGPQKFYLSEIVDYIYRVMRHDNKRTHIWPSFLIQAWILSKYPRNPHTNIDKLAQEAVSDKVYRDLMSVEDMGIPLTRLKDRVEYELRPWKKHAYYEEVLGEIDMAEPPVPITS